MLAEEGNDLARAFALAQAAREAAPNDASVADTLGWIFYKQKSYPAALALFEEAAEKLPGSAEVRYHLGLAQAAVGRKKEARASLQRALASGEGQTWAAGARRALGGL
jgi:tetratricopeptide (TPR) repeat protein